MENYSRLDKSKKPNYRLSCMIIIHEEILAGMIGFLINSTMLTRLQESRARNIQFHFFVNALLFYFYCFNLISKKTKMQTEYGRIRSELKLKMEQRR